MNALAGIPAFQTAIVLFCCCCFRLLLGCCCFVCFFFNTFIPYCVVTLKSHSASLMSDLLLEDEITMSPVAMFRRSIWTTQAAAALGLNEKLSVPFPPSLKTAS